MGSTRQPGSGQSQSSEGARMAVSSPAQPAPSSMDQYFMPPHLAPPPGYLSMHKNAEPLPRAPSSFKSAGKHRKMEESTDWQGIAHLRQIGPEEDMRLSTRCGPEYVVVHGVPEQCRRWLEDLVKPVPGFEYIKFYNPQDRHIYMAVLTFANRAAAERGFNELFHYFNASPVGMTWKPERVLLVNRTHLLPPRERTIKLKALIDASNPDHKDAPATVAPTCPVGKMPPPVPCEVPHSSVPSFPRAKQPPVPPGPDQALPPPPPVQAPLPGGPDQALPPLPTSTPPPLPPPNVAAQPLPDPPLPPWAEGTTAAGRPVPWKSAAEKTMQPPWVNGTGTAEPPPPWASGTTAVTDLPPHLQKAVEKQPQGPPLSGAPGSPALERLAGKTGEASSGSGQTPRRSGKQLTGRRPVPANSQHARSMSQVQAPEVHARRAQAAAAPQKAAQNAAKEGSNKPTPTTKPAKPKAGTKHAGRRDSGLRSSSQERTGGRKHRSPPLDAGLRRQISQSTSLERRPSDRRSAHRTRRDTSERHRRSPSPRRARSRSASLDRHHSGRKSADRSRQTAGTGARRGLSPTRPRDRSRTRCDAPERPHTARTSDTRERERRSADRRAASERGHSARRSRSPDRRRGSGSREMERLRADKRSPERPQPRSRSVQRRSSSPERRQSGPGGRPTPKVETLPSPPSRAGTGAAKRLEGFAEQRKPGTPSARQSQSSAPAHNHVLSSGPSGTRAKKQPRPQVSAAALPGPEPLESVNSGCAVPRQEKGGNQMAATALDKAQPGASGQRRAGLKRPLEAPVHGSDSSAGRQQSRAAVDTARKRMALDASSDVMTAAQKSAPLVSRTAALAEPQHSKWLDFQSDSNPAAAPAKQMSSPGSSKAQAHRVVAVADGCNGHSWQAAADMDRRVWVDNQPRCVEQMSNQPHSSGEAWPCDWQSPSLGDQMHPDQIDFRIKDSGERQYSTAVDSDIASHSDGDRVVHMGMQPVSFEMDDNPHRDAGDPFSMQIKHRKRSREYSQGLPSFQDVGASSDTSGPSLLHNGSSDHTQASNLPVDPRGQSYGKACHGDAPNSGPMFSGSAKTKRTHAGTQTGARKKQAIMKRNNLETLPKELTRRIHHLLARDDLRPEHFTKTIVAKLAALELPFAHKAIDWIMDVHDWSTMRNVPAELGQLVKEAEREANRELS